MLLTCTGDMATEGNISTNMQTTWNSTSHHICILSTKQMLPWLHNVLIIFTATWMVSFWNLEMLKALPQLITPLTLHYELKQPSRALHCLMVIYCSKVLQPCMQQSPTRNCQGYRQSNSIMHCAMHINTL